LSLVLYWVDGTLGSPVNGSWEVDSGEGLWLLSDGLLSLVSEEVLVLVMGPGGHVVVSEGEGVVSGVVVVDHVFLLGELVHSELEFLSGSVGEAVIVHVVDELHHDVVGVFLLASLKAEERGNFAELHDC